MRHPRLLRAMDSKDPDYRQCIHQVVPAVLGLRTEETGWYEVRQDIYPDHLILVEEHLNLPAWLAEHELQLHRLRTL